VPSAEQVQSIADLGGYALSLLIVAIAGIGLLRQWWVPGWFYRQERDARKTAEIQALRNAQALEKLRRELARDPRRRRPDGPPDG
jgi:hypothetical protein